MRRGAARIAVQAGCDVCIVEFHHGVLPAGAEALVPFAVGCRDAPAQAAHIADGVGAQLAAHAVDQHVHGVAADLLAPAIDAAFELVAREDGPGPLEQRVQQRELTRRELRTLALHQHFAGGDVQLDVGAADDGVGRAVAPPDDGAHARQQFAKLVGLDQVVVGADVQAGDPVVQAVAGGEHQHRRVVALAARLAQDLDAIALGQAQIEQHAGVAAVAEGALRQQAVLHPIDRPAVAAQCLLQALADHLVVFHQQNAHQPSGRNGSIRSQRASCQACDPKRRPQPGEAGASKHPAQQRRRRMRHLTRSIAPLS